VILLADARAFVAGVDALKARAKGMAAGLEPELSVVVDVMYPLEAITAAAKDFRTQFPRTPLRLYVEALGGAFRPVLDGRCGLGIVGSLPLTPACLCGERLSGVVMVLVASPDHPAAGRHSKLR
jgi:DNA-binding transcriptional LysR family regulator